MTYVWVSVIINNKQQNIYECQNNLCAKSWKCLLLVYNWSNILSHLTWWLCKIYTNFRTSLFAIHYHHYHAKLIWINHFRWPFTLNVYVVFMMSIYLIVLFCFSNVLYCLYNVYCIQHSFKKYSITILRTFGKT